MNKKYWIAGILVILAVVVYYFATNNNSLSVSEDVAKCIGGNSVLYTQEGCIHCIRQEEMFGDSFKFLNVVDCTGNWDKCPDVTGTPTWMINGEKYIGVQEIEKLRSLTGC